MSRVTNKLTDLRDLGRALKMRKVVDYNFNTPNVFGEDGKDHININTSGKLHLGRFLDPSHRSTITTEVGNFDSVLNLIFWLRHPQLDDRIRTMRSRELNQLTAEGKLKRLVNHRLVLCYYTYHKVLQNEKILESVRRLREDTIFLSYRVPKKSDIRITTGYAKMIIPVAIEIANAVKEDREPNWRLFIDSNITDKDVLPVPIREIVNKHFGND